jgi:holo-[acyl-carrier protein] synthase
MADAIIGLGLDITEIERIAATLARFGERFERRVFTDTEIAYCRRRRQPAMHFAGRFAAKEAAMKALGTGRALGVRWRDVEVVRHGGPPQLQLHGDALARAGRLGIVKALVTITHTDTLAVAEVLMLGASGQP